MDQSAAKLQIEAPSSSEIGKQVSAESTTRPGYILSALSAQVTGLHFVGTCRPIGQLFRLAMRTTLSVTDPDTLHVHWLEFFRDRERTVLINGDDEAWQ